MKNLKLKNLLYEDSAGTTKLTRDLEVMAKIPFKLKKKKMKLKRGQTLLHKRFGPFGHDYYYIGDIQIDGDQIPDDATDHFRI